MDHTLEGPTLYEHDGWYWNFAPVAPFGAPVGREHVTFGPVSVDLVGVEEVAA